MCLRPALLGSQSSRADRTDAGRLLRRPYLEAVSAPPHRLLPRQSRHAAPEPRDAARRRDRCAGAWASSTATVAACTTRRASIVRRAATRRWIACQLSYRGWYQGASPRPGPIHGAVLSRRRDRVRRRAPALCALPPRRLPPCARRHRTRVAPTRLDSVLQSQRTGARPRVDGRVATRRCIRDARGRAASRRRRRSAALDAWRVRASRARSDIRGVDHAAASRPGTRVTGGSRSCRSYIRRRMRRCTT